METQLVNEDWLALAEAAMEQPVDMDQPPEARPPFEVRDYGAANWCLRKIERIEQRCASRTAAVELEVARLRAWAERENAREREGADFLAGRLESWTRAELDGQKRRSMVLANGTVGFRATPGKVEIDDEENALAYCQANLPDAIIVKESLLKTVIADHFKKTGELPAGCTWVPGEDRFYVKTGTAA